MARRGGCLVTTVENPLLTGRIYIYYYSPSLTLSTYGFVYYYFYSITLVKPRAQKGLDGSVSPMGEGEKG